jgi:hypothetical protein
MIAQMARTFTYKIDYRYLPLLALCGVRPSKHGVHLGDDEFSASFGIFKVSTPLSNIEDAHVTRDYRWWTAVGPRLSSVDDGLTFGTNNRAGVCIHFREKVPSPLKRSGHSALTVTVEDLDGLVSSLTS